MATVHSDSKSARLDIKLDPSVKNKIEKASALLGKSLTEYIVKLAENDATEVIARYESIKLEDDVFDRFIDACIKAEGPNNALLEAGKFVKSKGFK